MPRKDYDEFLHYMQTHPNDKIFLSDYHTERRYPNNWGKVRLNGTIFVERELAELKELHQGVFIDLHPIDNIIPWLLKPQVRLAQFWACVTHMKCGMDKRQGLKVLPYRLFACLPFSVITFFKDLTIKAFKHLSTKYVYKIVHPNNGIYPIPCNTFEDLIEHKFEDKMFFIPRNYDEFLRRRYGDYMQIPPESQVYDCCTSIVECRL